MKIESSSRSISPTSTSRQQLTASLDKDASSAEPSAQTRFGTQAPFEKSKNEYGDTFVSPLVVSSSPLLAPAVSTRQIGVNSTTSDVKYEQAVAVLCELREDAHDRNRISSGDYPKRITSSLFEYWFSLSLEPNKQSIDLFHFRDVSLASPLLYKKTVDFRAYEKDIGPIFTGSSLERSALTVRANQAREQANKLQNMEHVLDKAKDHSTSTTFKGTMKTQAESSDNSQDFETALEKTNLTILACIPILRNEIKKARSDIPTGPDDFYRPMVNDLRAS